MNGFHAARVALAALLLATPALAPAQPEPQQQDWRASSMRGGTTVYIDAASITRNGDSVRFWAEMRRSEVQTLDDGTRYDRLGLQAEMNCAERTYQILQVYSALGDRRPTASPITGEVERIEEGTTAEVDMRAVCFNEWRN